jgi:hypothetical protein
MSDNVTITENADGSFIWESETFSFGSWTKDELKSFVMNKTNYDMYGWDVVSRAHGLLMSKMELEELKEFCLVDPYGMLYDISFWDTKVQCDNIHQRLSSILLFVFGWLYKIFRIKK